MNAKTAAIADSNSLNAMRNFTLVLTIALASMLVAAFISLLRKSRKLKIDRNKEYVSASMFSLLTTIFAFFLGFSIVTLWNNFSQTKNSVSSEAQLLFSSFVLAQNLDNSQAFRDNIRDYAQSVVKDEWPEMENSDQMSKTSEKYFREVWKSYQALKPADKSDNNIFANLGSILTQISVKRAERTTELNGNIYPITWVSIAIGFIAVVVSLFLMNTSNDLSKMIMEFFIIFLILSCVYFIYDISTPFSGIINVNQDAFVKALEAIDNAQY